LRHLEEVGFTGSPGVVDGADDEHVVTYMEGTFVHPHAWSDEGVWQVGRMLRDLHTATATFRLPPDAVWERW
jgi:Ser/Thr protein kinase RdoA (MazF antagonist)